ncbi:hypothetical protein M3221_10795 [Domibacillus indicus]|uniref:hypothetical protein n=1 Tax=Domibacillus indicus TaxID=1437523 RepID=UPI00203C3062|nr:hypothetical protein [Domibacillus indicus]MCM3788893.1 hypothetical protein [Domibacillus indicus]
MDVKSIYYIGFYNGEKSVKRKKYTSNLAGSMKMDFIIKSLKNIGYSVKVISITIPPKAGWYPEEKIKVDEKEKFYYLPVLNIKIFKRRLFPGKISVIFLFMWGLRNLKKEDTVIVYHALPLYPIISLLKKIIKFKLIIQVEEIYSLANNKKINVGKLKKEEKSISIADKYLFVNDILPDKYALGKPFAVSYGNYSIFDEKKNVPKNLKQIGVVYTGIINEERGAFKVISAMSLLPDNYSLHILGFGKESNIKKMHDLISNVNSTAGIEKVKFYGTKTGDEYTKFLKKFHIGISLMDNSNDISTSAFPSKILAYLGHSLFVVSSKNKCITESKVKDLLYFCNDDSGSIAKAILSIDITQPNYAAKRLRLLENNFQRDLERLILKEDILDNV